jgi:hypothetical protein
MMGKNIIEGKWRSFREDLLIRYNNKEADQVISNGLIVAGR